MKYVFILFRISNFPAGETPTSRSGYGGTTGILKIPVKLGLCRPPFVTDATRRSLFVPNVSLFRYLLRILKDKSSLTESTRFAVWPY